LVTPCPEGYGKHLTFAHSTLRPLILRARAAFDPSLRVTYN
jgi:hypothetical protein